MSTIPSYTASFTVVDVGQGLSQILVYNDSAIVFDMGPAEGACEWRKTYSALGSPPIAYIVISHRDRDHSEGLLGIDDNILWTGIMITGYHEDTAFLRNNCSEWNRELRITTIRQGDSLLFGNGCTVHCLWPPPSISDSLPVAENLTNRYSLVLSLRIHRTGILLPSDIDSGGVQSLYRKFGPLLQSELLVLPHHGSWSSVDCLFYAYVQPEIAIVSAGQNNDFGHPSYETLETLARLGISWESTATTGSLTWISNGFYWTALF